MESFSVARDFFSTIVERVLRSVLINKFTKQRWEDLEHRIKALPEYNRRHPISFLRIVLLLAYFLGIRKHYSKMWELQLVISMPSHKVFL